MQPFCKLADPSTYVACDWAFSLDPDAPAPWVEFFIAHLETILHVGVEAAIARGESRDVALARAAACRADFVERFNHYARDPGGFGRVTILTFDMWRDQILRRNGFVDPFIDLK